MAGYVTAAPPPISPETLRAMSAGAINGFLRLADFWRWTGDQRAQALGYSVTRQTIASWAKRSPDSISEDQLVRISYLLGIYEGLMRFYSLESEAGKAWMNRRNVEEPFYGRTPQEFILNGGIKAFELTRAYVDGLTGGPPSRAFTAEAFPAPTSEFTLPESGESW